MATGEAHSGLMYRGPVGARPYPALPVAGTRGEPLRAEDALRINPRDRHPESL
jgi:hypothetical protein